MPEKQRRCGLRAHILNTLSLNDTEGDIVFDVKDISEGGAFIYSNLLFEEGQKVSLTFTLPGGHVVKTDAVIIRSEKNDDNNRLPGMAVRFTTISRADSQAINDFVLKATMGHC